MRDQIGQLMMVGFDGRRPSEAFLDFLREESIGGIILFRRNISSPKQLWKLTEELQDAVQTHLLIAVDHEGGDVFRMPKPFTHFPPMREVAKRASNGHSKVVYDIGRVMAEELLACGINANLAPVVDVDTNPFNPVIGKRSFSTNPHEVAELACQLIAGLEDGGIMSCAKHFPGHGDTNQDSHAQLAFLSHTRKRFEECEFLPFRRAIAQGVPAIMTAHVFVPLLDPNHPATTSHIITTSILRAKLGFRGLILSDDLLMRGISDLMPIPEAVVRSVQAGADMLIVSRDFDIQRKSLEALKRAFDDGAISSHRLESSLERISQVKHRYCQFPESPPSLRTIGSKKHRMVCAFHTPTC